MCQRVKKKVDTARPELNPIAVKSPWYHVGIDFIGPLSPPTKRGNRYILTLMDYFTKFAWAKEMPTKEAENVVAALKEVMLRAQFHSCAHQYIIIIKNILFRYYRLFNL